MSTTDLLAERGSYYYVESVNEWKMKRIPWKSLSVSWISDEEERKEKVPEAESTFRRDTNNNVPLGSLFTQKSIINGGDQITRAVTIQFFFLSSVSLFWIISGNGTREDPSFPPQRTFSGFSGYSFFGEFLMHLLEEIENADYLYAMGVVWSSFSFQRKLYTLSPSGGPAGTGILSGSKETFNSWTNPYKMFLSKDLCE